MNTENDITPADAMRVCEAELAKGRRPNWRFMSKALLHKGPAPTLGPIRILPDASKHDGSQWDNRPEWYKEQLRQLAANPPMHHDPRWMDMKQDQDQQAKAAKPGAVHQPGIRF